jgi:hypothetical protein
MSWIRVSTYRCILPAYFPWFSEISKSSSEDESDDDGSGRRQSRRILPADSLASWYDYTLPVD